MNSNVNVFQYNKYNKYDKFYNNKPFKIICYTILVIFILLLSIRFKLILITTVLFLIMIFSLASLILITIISTWIYYIMYPFVFYFFSLSSLPVLLNEYDNKYYDKIYGGGGCSVETVATVIKYVANQKCLNGTYNIVVNYFTNDDYNYNYNYNANANININNICVLDNNNCYDKNNYLLNTNITLYKCQYDMNCFQKNTSNNNAKNLYNSLFFHMLVLLLPVLIVFGCIATYYSFIYWKNMYEQICFHKSLKNSVNSKQLKKVILPPREENKSHIH